jgi:hypothetical protein
LVAFIRTLDASASDDVIDLNMLGRYAFTIREMVARGELRPLRDPGVTGVDDV